MKILLAEDNELNQKIISYFISKAGYDLVIVDNGKKVLASLEKDRFDLILMDMQMPEMDGIEATKIIRNSEFGIRHTPIIALTAYAMKGDKERLMEAGMDDYIPKPVNMENLLYTIQRVLIEKSGVQK